MTRCFGATSAPCVTASRPRLGAFPLGLFEKYAVVVAKANLAFPKAEMAPINDSGFASEAVVLAKAKVVLTKPALVPVKDRVVLAKASLVPAKAKVVLPNASLVSAKAAVVRLKDRGPAKYASASAKAVAALKK